MNYFQCIVFDRKTFSIVIEINNLPSGKMLAIDDLHKNQAAFAIACDNEKSLILFENFKTSKVIPLNFSCGKRNFANGLFTLISCDLKKISVINRFDFSIFSTPIPLKIEVEQAISLNDTCVGVFKKGIKIWNFKSKFQQVLSISCFTDMHWCSPFNDIYLDTVKFIIGTSKGILVFDTVDWSKKMSIGDVVTRFCVQNLKPVYQIHGRLLELVTKQELTSVTIITNGTK